MDGDGVVVVGEVGCPVDGGDGEACVCLGVEACVEVVVGVVDVAEGGEEVCSEDLEGHGDGYGDDDG